jgi:hypothetical protein
MRHLDESAILAIRDVGEVGDAERAHLEGCASCAAALEAARARAVSIEHALSSLDRPIEPTAAKAGVRARLAQKRVAAESGRWGGWHLGRAAALLLVTAGAAAALPGSPLRSLWSPPPAETDPAGELPTLGAPQGPGADARSPLDDPGIAVAVPDGFVHVVVRGADPGTEMWVVWRSEPSARVIAPPGSRFTYAAGRVEVDASRGAIRVELPSGVEEVSLEVDGQIFLQGRPQSLSVFGPAVERSQDSILFLVDGP